MKKVILVVFLWLNFSFADCTDYLVKFQKYANLSEDIAFNSEGTNLAAKAGLYYQKFMICREVKKTPLEKKAKEYLKYIKTED